MPSEPSFAGVTPGAPLPPAGCVECGREIHVKRVRLCKYHYEIARMSGTVCTIPDCRRPQKVKSVGLCGPHYDRFRLAHGLCAVLNCGQPLVTKTYCNMHYKRVRKFGTAGPIGRLKARAGEGTLTRGYRVFTIGGQKVREHRQVMEGVLGRRLSPNEAVHHRNGDRADNRPDNLELWTRPHPAGQRISDVGSR